MFSRRWTWIVLAGWLLITGWFVVRDLGPRWRTAEPAPFAIGIGDEPRLSLVGTPRPRPIEVQWQIYRNDLYRAGSVTITRMQYNQWNDTLEFFSEFKMKDSPRRTGTSWLEVESSFRVDWEGRLLDFDAELRLRREPLLLTNPALVGRIVGAWLPGLTEHVPEWPFLRLQPAYSGGAFVGPLLTVPGLLTYDWPSAFRLPGQQWLRPAPEQQASRQFRSLSPADGLGRRGPPPGARALLEAPLALYTDAEVAVRCRGTVRDSQFLPQWRMSGEQREPTWNPVALSPRGHVLLPFHPLNRLPGLQAGQRWTVPLIDLEAALNMDRTREVRSVRAEVSVAGPDDWHYKSPAFLVTYRDGDRVVARAVVRQSDFLVLRQELTFSSDRYTLERQER